MRPQDKEWFNKHLYVPIAGRNSILAETIEDKLNEIEQEFAAKDAEIKRLSDILSELTRD